MKQSHNPEAGTMMLGEMQSLQTRITQAIVNQQATAAKVQSLEQRLETVIQTQTRAAKIASEALTEVTRALTERLESLEAQVNLTVDNLATLRAAHRERAATLEAEQERLEKRIQAHENALSVMHQRVSSLERA